MKKITNSFCALAAIGGLIVLSSCSKSSSSNNSVTPPGTALFPLALNNTWNYKLKHYNTSTGTLADSSFFTLAIKGKIAANGADYYQFQNAPDTTTLESLAEINSTTLSSIDSASGIDFYTFFVSGTGDSTKSISSWPINVSANGTICEGTDNLYAHYADTTLINEDGITYTSSIKNVIVSHDCSGNKVTSSVYFIKQGVGLVRFSKYIYSSAGKPLLELAWVLESETLN